MSNNILHSITSCEKHYFLSKTKNQSGSMNSEGSQVTKAFGAKTNLKLKLIMTLRLTSVNSILWLGFFKTFKLAPDGAGAYNYIICSDLGMIAYYARTFALKMRSKFKRKNLM
jgi:hypothetical protein